MRDALFPEKLLLRQSLTVGKYATRSLLSPFGNGILGDFKLATKEQAAVGAATAGNSLHAAAQASQKMVDDLKEQARRLALHCNSYRGSIPHIAARQLVTTLVLLVAVVAAMFATVDHAYWLTLVLAFPAAGLLIRCFIIQHDCGHGSFLSSRTGNDAVGRFLSVLTFTPYGLWKREHAQHHASSGNLERRGVGDIDTWTVREWKTAPRLEQMRYALYRNPLFLFGFGVPFYFLVLQRLPWFHPYPAGQTWKSVIGLNLGLLLLYTPIVLAFGWLSVVMVVLPVLHLTAALGGWLFFIQHQFEGTHWEHSDEWQFQVAALQGSSYYVLPRWLNWFTGDIALHHIHHLNSMIPNYRLQDCLKASPELQAMNRLSIADSLRCAKLKLWDESSRRLVTFAEARAL